MTVTLGKITSEKTFIHSFLNISASLNSQELDTSGSLPTHV